MTSGMTRLSALDDPPCPRCATSLTTGRAGNRTGGSWYCYRCSQAFDPGPVIDTDVAHLLLEHTTYVAIPGGVVTYDVRRDRLAIVGPDGRAEVRPDAYYPHASRATRALDCWAVAYRCNAALADTESPSSFTRAVRDIPD